MKKRWSERQDLNLPQVLGIPRGDSDRRPKYSRITRKTAPAILTAALYAALLLAGCTTAPIDAHGNAIEARR